MRNLTKIIQLKNGWLLKVTLFQRTGEIGIGLTRKDWLPTNRFSSRILLDLNEAQALQRKLQSLIDKASRGDDEGVQKKKEKEET